jgi:formylglycine-generating enzyme required for sulfatase activity
MLKSQIYRDSRSRTSSFGPLGTTRTTVAGVSFDMVKVPPGRFVDGEAISKRERLVSRAFEIGVSLVTEKLWWTVMRRDPYVSPNADRPMPNMTWERALEFLVQLHRLGFPGFRLPTEAEWAWAVRCGVPTYWAGSDRSSPVMTEEAEASDRVCSRAPSAVGAFDFSGNLWEWQQDWFGGLGAGIDAQGPEQDDDFGHANRGGAWDRDVDLDARVNARDDGTEGDRMGSLGFRLVRAAH